MITLMIRTVRDASIVVMGTFICLLAIALMAVSQYRSDVRNWEQHRRSEADRAEIRLREAAVERRLDDLERSIRTHHPD